MPANEILGQNPGNRILSFKLDESRLNASKLAGQVSIPTIQNLAFEQKEWVTKSVGGDVLSKFSKFVIWQWWKRQAGWMEPEFLADHGRSPTLVSSSDVVYELPR